MQLISIKVCSALLLGFLSLTQVVSAPVRATSVGDSPFSESNPASPDMNTTTPRSLFIYARSPRPDLHRRSKKVQATVEFVKFDSNVTPTIPPTQGTLTALRVVLRNLMVVYYPPEQKPPEIELAVKGPQPELQDLQCEVSFSDPNGIIPNKKVYQVSMSAPWLSKPGLPDGGMTGLSGLVLSNTNAVLRFTDGIGRFSMGSVALRKNSFKLDRFA
ncbi:hypothetical protein C8J55DRAFT_510355 [Lentinula edodes]|uniref:Uncharacterized protein n=1 Tax=Lentinula lateritia TaxID=40482 RepID=A0A9W9ALJ0_9AGAR|nr:hypothetical protein C8J55DRAFT_510355 [Lentinula edodes]